MLPRPLITGITVLVTLAWTVNVVLGFLDPARHDPTINAIFAVVAGAIYALGGKDGGRVGSTRRALGHLIAGDTPPTEHHEGTGDEH